MAYIKQTWIDNESPLTAERMNHIEDGISSVEYQVSQVQGGTPKAVTQASEMTDTSLIYLYMGDETGYESGHFYYFDGTQWQDGGQYGADGGINTNARNLLKYILERVAYTETGMQVYVDALYQALAQGGGGGGGTTTYTIINALTNVTNSNDATGCDEGDSYTATLTPDTDYAIDSVTVTMGGVDITSTAYSSGTITIASVTGDIVITASAIGFLSTLGFFKGASGSVQDNVFSVRTYDIRRAIAFCTKAFNNAVAITSTAEVRSNGWVDPKYPIPIPNGATKISVSLQGDLRCAIPVIKYQNGNTVSVDNGSWSSNGGVSNYDLSSFIASGGTHLVVLFGNSTTTTLANYTIDSTTVQISFS